MPKTPEDTSPASWQRFFAASANNAAWDLAEMPRDQVDALALLNAAHAAAWHWQAAGTELHQMRALMLVAQAHALAGLGPSALLHAGRVRTYFLAQPATPDWELAFVHAIHAHAAHAAGDGRQHADSYALVAAAIDAIARDEDRAVVMRLFEHVPHPAGDPSGQLK